MSNIIAFIPARSGSKSVPHKNIKNLGGRPLIAYSIESGLQSGFRTIVNTDSEEYATIIREFGAEVQMRSDDLGEDTTSMYQLLKSELFKLSPIPEVVVLLQPTTPLRPKNQVKLAIDFFTNNLDRYDSLITAELVPEKFNPSQVVVATQMGFRMANGAPISQRITRRQEFPLAYIPTGSIYVFKTSNLEKGSIYGERTMIMETEGMININSQKDFEEAELWLQK